MRVLEALKRTGNAGKEMLREGLQTALEKWDDAERALRRKMRVYPALAPATPAARFGDHPLLRRRERRAHPRDDAEQRRYEDAERKAIVSIHGRDLSSEDEIEKARPEEKDRKAA